uniref:NADH-ubiquinone oxidoreductase chain 6 n=1 Tax=Anilios australis TaxID=71009 RepID=A0PDP6_9SAUR|nr:NADH dehydrogenase subunit 6 [Anilios australis]
MEFFIFLLCLCIVIGLYGLCSSVVPYFGVVCVIISSVFSCGLIAAFGSAFVSLLLFIVYLGGMMVVFAYSVAMTEGFEFADMKGRIFVWESMVLSGVLGVVIMLSLWVSGVGSSMISSFGDGLWGFVLVDGVGVALLYSVGWVSLVVCGWGLLLVLFVVVEMVRCGFHGGTLRSV